MPYEVVKRDGKFCLQKPDKTLVPGSCHKDRASTLQILRAIMANENKAMEQSIYHGGAIKALGNGRVGGFLVNFSTEDKPDLDGEYFTKSTEFFIENGARLPVLYDHGLDPVLKRRKLGVASVEMQEAGLWLEAQLNLRDAYEKAVYHLVEKNKAGWSSGAAGHLSGRKKGAKATEIVEWGLAEASITVRPADYDNRVIALKSYQPTPIEIDEGEARSSILTPNALSAVLNRHIEDRIDDGKDRASIIKSMAREAGLEVETINHILDDTFRASDANLKAFARVLDISFDMLKSATRKDYARTIKGMFEEALSDQIPSRWQLDSIYCDIVKKIAHTAQASAITGVEFDSDAKIKEATGEYLNRLQSLAIGQVNSYVESNSDEPFYLKAVISTSEALETDSLDPDQHSELVASAVTGIVKRFRKFHETRLKAGRVLSDKNRQRLATMLEQIESAVSDCRSLLDESKPMATEEAMRTARTKHLRLKAERRASIGVI
jgi:hypothetical protein